jgi:AmmeMemoRadiSam system protein A
MDELNHEERRALLAIARRALIEATLNKRMWQPDSAEGRLLEPRGAFVTLERRGKLRGCVGQMSAQQPLARTVGRCAVAAALEDRRFDPVSAAEAGELTIEISVLSPAVGMRPEDIEIGKHGLVIERGDFRGVLLPAVALEHRLDRERFLAETCRKAGLPLDAWKSPGTRVLGFTSEVFSEAETVGSGQHSAPLPPQTAAAKP